MKKILAVILVLAMALSVCLSLTSCSGVSEKDIEKDPAETLSNSFDNTFKSFFKDGIGLYGVIEKASERSALDVYFESEDLLGKDLTHVGATLYTDIKNKNLVIAAKATYKGDELKGKAYINKDGAIVSGESVLGSYDSYGVFYDTLIEKFKGSTLSGMMGMDDESAQKLVDLVKELQELMNKKAKEQEKKTKELVKSILNTLDQTVSSKKLEIGDKEIDCIVLGYQLTNQNLEEAVRNVYVNDLKDYDIDGEIMESINDFFEEFNENVDIEIEFNIALQKSNNTIVKIYGDGELTTNRSTEYASTANIKIDADFSDTMIKLTAETYVNGTESAIEVTIEKKVEKGNVTYTMKAVSESGSTSLDLASAEFLFEKGGNFKLSAKVMASAVTSTEFEVEGTYEIGKNKAEFEISSVKYGNAKVNFKLGISLEADPKIPETPEDAKDVVNFSEEEWNEVIKDFENSDLGKIIAGK